MAAPAAAVPFHSVPGSPDAGPEGGALHPHQSTSGGAGKATPSLEVRHPAGNPMEKTPMSECKVLIGLGRRQFLRGGAVAAAGDAAAAVTAAAPRPARALP